jgi:hypothetical protein
MDTNATARFAKLKLLLDKHIRKYGLQQTGTLGNR